METTPHFTKLQDLINNNFTIKPIEIYWIDPSFKGGNFIS